MTFNALFILFGIGILISRLLNDNQKDKGQYKKAKVFQAICLGIIIVTCFGSIRYLGWTLRHFDKAYDRFSVEVGIFPGSCHFIIFLVNVASMLTVVVLAYLMMARSNGARKLLFYFLPVVSLTEVFSFYRGWLSTGDDLDVKPVFILLIGFIICGSITSAILAVYSSGFMKDFFNSSAPEIEVIEKDVPNSVTENDLLDHNMPDEENIP